MSGVVSTTAVRALLARPAEIAPRFRDAPNGGPAEASADEGGA